MEKFCPKCKNYCEIIDKIVSQTYIVNKETVQIETPEQVCKNCGEIISNDEKDQEILDLIIEIIQKKDERKNN